MPTPSDWDEEPQKPETTSDGRVRMATGTIPPNRSARHAADNVIETGEIDTERRSLVVRSAKVPTVEWSDEPTEISVPALPTSRRPNLQMLWIAGAVVFGVIAVLLMMRVKPDPDAIQALHARADTIAVTIDREAGGAMVRAEAIATSPTLRYAVDTDAVTLANMVKDGDWALTLEPGDVFEVFQIRDGKRLLLLRLPANARPVSPIATGQTNIESSHGQLMVTASAPVKDNRNNVAGMVVLSRHVDLAPVAKDVSKHASGATLNGLREAVDLIASKTRPNVTIPITTKTPIASGSLALAASVAQPTATLPYVFLGLSLLLVAGFIFTSVRARRRA